MHVTATGNLLFHVTATGNLLFLVVCVFQGTLLPHAQCGAAVMSRDKRSDDPPAMEAVVNTLSERLTQLEAQVTAQGNANSQLQHQHDQLQSRVGKQREDEKKYNAAGYLIFIMLPDVLLGYSRRMILPYDHRTVIFLRHHLYYPICTSLANMA